MNAQLTASQPQRRAGGPAIEIRPESQRNRGKVLSVRGSVVEAFFERQLPPINSVLLAGERGQIVIEVLSQAGPQRVRGEGARWKEHPFADVRCLWQAH